LNDTVLEVRGLSEEVKLLRDSLPQFKLASLFAEVHEELCDLVCIHARGRHLDGTSPVEVIVTKIKGKLLYHGLLKWRIIVSHIVVSWQDTTLSRILRHQVKIVLGQVVLVLNHLLINK
jgi:hypothetical protein